jgi:hypothetical protein
VVGAKEEHQLITKEDPLKLDLPMEEPKLNIEETKGHISGFREN